MSTLPPPVPAATTPVSKEDEEYKQICEEYKQIIETAPRGNGWFSEYLHNYKGFWLGSDLIKGNLVVQKYLKTQPTDIFITSYLKSGTTWLKALVFSTINRHNYTFSDHYLHHHTPHNAFTILDLEAYPVGDDFGRLPAPRLLASHFPHTLLPPCVIDSSCKLVYICRDPKDVLISKWYFSSSLRPKHLRPLLLDDAFELFCQGVSLYGPIWEHALSYWKASLECPEKVLFLKYEDMKKEPVVMLRKLAAFLGKPFTEDEEAKGVVDEIVKFCSFENLSNLKVNKEGVVTLGATENPYVIENKGFFRKGETGDWKNHLTPEMKERIDKITHDKFKGSGLSFGVTTDD